MIKSILDWINSYPIYIKILAVLIFMLFLYKFGYIVGKFIANIGL